MAGSLFCVDIPVQPPRPSSTPTATPRMEILCIVHPTRIVRSMGVANTSLSSALDKAVVHEQANGCADDSENSVQNETLEMR